MRHQLQISVLAVSALAAGCRTVPPPGPSPGPPPSRHLVDGFERDGLWSLDSADNYGRVSYVAEHVTEGKYAMRLSFFDNGRGKTLFRREVSYDLSGAGNLWLDVYNHTSGTGTACAVAFSSDRGGFFETKALPLEPGPNRDLHFDIRATGMKSGTDTNAWLARCDSVRRAMILVFPGANSEGALTVDNLRADRSGVNRSPLPRVKGITGVPRSVRLHVPVELVVRLDAAALEDSASLQGTLLPVDLQARLIGPDGKQQTVRGFLKSGAPGTDVSYAVRFTPTLTGTWRLQLGLVVQERWKELRDVSFECRSAPDVRGMIGIDPRDPMFFSFANGEPFYPIGQNVCWAADYGPYFRAIKAYGGNTARVWTCPWNNPLLEKDNVYEINRESAAAIDRIFVLAREHGVYVQLVLSYHGSLDRDWHRNPFNAVNGGPCALPQDFWVQPAARKAFKRLVDYAVRRWSADPHLFAWELMNEADFTPRYRDEDVIAWHREMGDYLKRVDRHGHLVTASIVNDERLAEIWEQPAVDFTNSHFYDTALARALNERLLYHRRFNKPYFITEIGRGWRAADDQADPQGRYLQHALWLAWMTPAAGNCLPWWWDTHIEPNRLESHFAALASFNRDEVRRGQGYRSWACSLNREDGTAVQIQGLANPGNVFGFVYDARALDVGGPVRDDLMLAEEARLLFDGLLDGDYAMQTWRTHDGTVAEDMQLQANDGRLMIPLPAGNTNFAFKVKLLKQPGVSVRVE